MKVPAEELAQATGFQPGRPARVSGEQWTMENIREPFNGSKEDVYSRYRLARRPKRKKRGQGYAEVESGREKGQRRDSLITATSLRQVALQRAERAFLRYGVMMEEGG